MLNLSEEKKNCLPFSKVLMHLLHLVQKTVGLWTSKKRSVLTNTLKIIIIKKQLNKKPKNIPNWFFNVIEVFLLNGPDFSGKRSKSFRAMV